MVFEQIYNIKEVKSNYFNIFVMGFIFSEIGILASFLAFGDSVGLMSVAFTAVVSLPFVFYLINTKDMGKNTGSKSFFLDVFHNNKVTFESYIFLFLGIFFSFTLYSLFLPEHAVVEYFREQLFLFNDSGNAVAGGLSFAGILINNVKVLFIFFILSILFGAGSVLFLAWNASVWGILLGYFIKVTSSGSNLLLRLFDTLIRFFPHMILEAAAYLIAIISGVIISQTIVAKEITSDKKTEIVMQGVFLLIASVIILFLAGYVEVYIYPLL